MSEGGRLFRVTFGGGLISQNGQQGVIERGIRIRTLSQFYDEWLGKLPLSELERATLFFDIREVHGARYVRVKRMLDLLSSVTNGTREEILFALSSCVPEYQPQTTLDHSANDQASKLRLLAARAA